jgi:hypothetical protein
MSHDRVAEFAALTLMVVLIAIITYAGILY